MSGEDEGTSRDERGRATNTSGSSSSRMRAVESIPLPVDTLKDVFITHVACAPEGTAVIAEFNEVYVTLRYAPLFRYSL